MFSKNVQKGGITSGGGNKSSLTSPSMSRSSSMRLYGSSGIVSPNENSPGLFDLSSFDTELLSEVCLLVIYENLLLMLNPQSQGLIWFSSLDVKNWITVRCCRLYLFLVNVLMIPTCSYFLNIQMILVVFQRTTFRRALLQKKIGLVMLLKSKLWYSSFSFYFLLNSIYSALLQIQHIWLIFLITSLNLGKW